MCVCVCDDACDVCVMYYIYSLLLLLLLLLLLVTLFIYYRRKLYRIRAQRGNNISNTVVTKLEIGDFRLKTAI